jgi:dihydrofolate reductase
MAKLIYPGIMSLDGYIEDENGSFDWAEPDEEVHAFVNDQTRPIGTHLYGRRTYELMTVWETDPSLAEQSPLLRDFAEIWQAADKIVYSSALATPSTARTRVERHFAPEAIRELKTSSARDLIIGGPTLAAHAVRAGLVDEYHLYLNPVVVGGGKPYLPDHVRLHLDLLAEHRFASGVVHLRYGTKSTSG